MAEDDDEAEEAFELGKAEALSASMDLSRATAEALLAAHSPGPDAQVHAAEALKAGKSFLGRMNDPVAEIPIGLDLQKASNLSEAAERESVVAPGPQVIDQLAGAFGALESAKAGLGNIANSELRRLIESDVQRGESSLEHAWDTVEKNAEMRSLLRDAGEDDKTSTETGPAGGEAGRSDPMAVADVARIDEADATELEGQVLALLSNPDRSQTGDELRSVLVGQMPEGHVANLAQAFDTPSDLDTSAGIDAPAFEGLEIPEIVDTHLQAAQATSEADYDESALQALLRGADEAEQVGTETRPEDDKAGLDENELSELLRDASAEKEVPDELFSEQGTETLEGQGNVETEPTDLTLDEESEVTEQESSYWEAAPAESYELDESSYSEPADVGTFDAAPSTDVGTAAAGDVGAAAAGDVGAAAAGDAGAGVF
jgi:hypothetical protein